MRQQNILSLDFWNRNKISDYQFRYLLNDPAMNETKILPWSSTLSNYKKHKNS